MEMMNVDSEHIDHFSALIDDCVFHIFNWLSFDDLWCISRTSQKFQALADSYFNRKYPVTNPINIIQDNDGVSFGRTEKYVKHFSHRFRNVNILFGKRELSEQLVQFIRSKCCDNFNKIFVQGKWSRAFEEGIKDALRNVEIVSFDVWSDDIWLDGIFNCFPAVKHLKLRHGCPISKLRRDYINLKMPDIEYPLLEVFELQIHRFELIEQLQHFFRKNPTIKRFVCTMYCPDTEWLKSIIRIVTLTYIEELFIEVLPGANVDFAFSRNDFRMLEERENFKRLEFSLSESLGLNVISNLCELASLNTFKGFHLRNMGFVNQWSDHIAVMNSFVNLTTLQVQCNRTADAPVSSWKNLSKNLVCLEELYYSGHVHEHILTAFVRNSPKLRKIFVVPFHFIGRDKLIELNKERKALKGAANLIIYLQSSIFYRVTFQNNKHNVLVQIKEFVPANEYYPNPFVYREIGYNAF